MAVYCGNILTFHKRKKMRERETFVSMQTLSPLDFARKICVCVCLSGSCSLSLFLSSCIIYLRPKNIISFDVEKFISTEREQKIKVELRKHRREVFALSRTRAKSFPLSLFNVLRQCWLFIFVLIN